MTGELSTLSDLVHTDLINMTCGELLGQGVARTVFVYALDDTKVIKVERLHGSFQNVAEYLMWEDLKETKYARYLAPVHAISPHGSFLIMSRVNPLTTQPVRSEKLPNFLTDFKPGNYGMLKGRLVCCDYGSNMVMNHGAFASKMISPRWWDGSAS